MRPEYWPYEMEAQLAGQKAAVGSSYSGRIFPEILAHPENSLEQGW